MAYSIAQFEQGIANMKPRPFDVYILPAFAIWYAIRSKTAMGRKARRILFISGIYMGYRNYAEYKKLVAQVQRYAAARIGVQNEEGSTV